MKEPKTAKNTTYYTITFFQDPTKHGKTLDNCYKTENGALKKAKTLKIEAPKSKVIIRKEIVYFRDYNNEISTSTPHIIL